MNLKYLNKLEFYKVLDRLQNFAITILGKELIRKFIAFI